MKMTVRTELDFEDMSIFDLERLIKYAEWALADKVKAKDRILKSDDSLRDALRVEMQTKSKIHAVKLYRELTGGSLMQGMELVNSIEKNS